MSSTLKGWSDADGAGAAAPAGPPPFPNIASASSTGSSARTIGWSSATILAISSSMRARSASLIGSGSWKS